MLCLNEIPLRGTNQGNLLVFMVGDGGVASKENIVQNGINCLIQTV